MRKFIANLKRTISLSLTLAILISTLSMPNVLAARAYDASIYILGSKVGFTNIPYEMSGVIYAPLEEICGYLNLDCKKQDSGDTYEISRGPNTVVLQSGNMICKLNGESLILSGQPRLKNDKVYVPVDMFDVCFGMPIKVDITARYADITPNVYKIYVDADNAAAISSSTPDSDTLKTGASDMDELFALKDKKGNEKSLFYKFDLSDYEGYKISNVNLILVAGRGSNWYPHIELCRVKNWDKKTISFNNQPEMLSEDVIVGSTFGERYQMNASTTFPSSYSVTKWAQSAIDSKEILAIKVLGVPDAGNTNPSSPQVFVKGVNTSEKAYLEITVDEKYNFPIAKEERESTVDKNVFGAISFFKKMGVIHDGEEFPSDLSEGITRGEFVRYAVRLFGDGIKLGNTEPIFADVTKESPYYDDIALAASLKLISAEKGSNFRPDDIITYYEAITIACRMVGYSMYADNNGGYPGGYVAAAQKGKMLRNIKALDIFGFDSAFELLLNTLGAPIFDATSYDSNGGAVYSFLENETLLSRYWDAYKLEGRITGNEYTDIDSSKAGNGKQLSIEGKKVFIDDEEYNSLIGYSVIVYCSKDDDKALYVGADTGKDDIEKIDFADIEDAKDESNSVVIHYSENESKSRTEEISKTVWVIYNGKTVPQNKISSDLFKAETGNVVIIDNEVVIITAYTTVVVNSVDVEKELIADQYDAYDKAIRLEDVDYYVFRNESGEVVPLEGIQRNDVLSIAISLDGKLVFGELARRTLTTKLESIYGTKGSEDCTVTLNGGEYKLINQYSKWTDLISFDKTGTYLFDCFGNIAGYINMGSENNFGYLLAMSPQRGLSGNVEVAINILDAETYVKYELADRVNIDGESFKDADEILQYFEDSSTNSTKKQGIVFGLNSESKINKIDTAIVGQKENEETSLCLRYTADKDQLMYKAGRLGDLYYVDIETALTVCTPDNPLNLGDYETIKAGIKNEDEFHADIYSIGNKKPSADILILKNYGITNTVGEFAQLSLVSKIRTALNEDDEVIKKLYLYDVSTEEISIDVPKENESLLDGINPGDLVRVGKDRKNQLGALTKYYDYASKQIVDNTRYAASYFNYNVRIYGGYVVDIIDQFVKFGNDLNDTREENYRWYNFAGVKNLYKYEVGRSGDTIISEATVNDMYDYTHVPYAPSGIIIQTRYANQFIGGYVIELGKPANTGIYKVEFKAGEGGSGNAPDFIRADIGDEITLPSNSFVRSEYDFEGWVTENDSTVYQPGDTYIVDGNTVFNAKWTYVGRQYNINFVGGDGATGTATMLMSSSGKTISLPDNPFTKRGHKFIGWSDGYNEFLPGDSYTVPENDVTFNAVWVKSWDSTAAETAPTITEINGQTYYEIGDGTQLAWFANQVNGGQTNINAVLTDDIYLNYGGEHTENWYPFVIGKSTDLNFEGTFDGAGHTIDGLYSYDSYGNQGGLFGFIGNTGVVKNLTLVNTKLATGYGNGQSYVGAIAAQNSGTISNCSAYGDIVAVENGNLDGAGGLVGLLLNGTVSDCYNGMNIISEVGYDSTSQASSYNSGVGGIAAKAKDAFVIERCGNGGIINVPKLIYVGGIVGRIDSTTGTYSDCYNTADITAGWNVAGIFGYSNSNAVINASMYNTGNIEAKQRRAAGLFNNALQSTSSINHASYSTGTVISPESEVNYSGLLYTYDTNYMDGKFDSKFIYPTDVAEGVEWTIGKVTCGTGINRGTGLPISEINTFEAINMLNEWAGEELYKIDDAINNGYPSFVWQN